ncbi:MAG TPA: dTDP-4-dehydrorhamnose 3,5-epimerase [Candidatus Acidoferrales bacterium]|nr:dTDP-4-dehydrorhamnose 3,5-epimerase [Candidatus Acidoferrales bacterium]
MKFLPTEIPGVYIIEPELIADERGFFARTFCAKEFAARGFAAHMAQCSISFNRRKGTLRGMHYQAAPHEEARLVRCTRGAIFDVVLDLRERSAAFGRWAGFELTAENRRTIYIPEGMAHGFQTLADETEVHYQMSAAYEEASARGVRWNDPAFAIRWPMANPILSERDARHASWK